jgi:hypothetical protein
VVLDDTCKAIVHARARVGRAAHDQVRTAKTSPTPMQWPRPVLRSLLHLRAADMRSAAASPLPCPHRNSRLAKQLRASTSRQPSAAAVTRRRTQPGWTAAPSPRTHVATASPCLSLVTSRRSGMQHHSFVCPIITQPHSTFHSCLARRKRRSDKESKEQQRHLTAAAAAAAATPPSKSVIDCEHCAFDHLSYRR